MKKKKNEPDKSIELPKMKHVLWECGTSCIICGQYFYRTYQSKYWSKICSECIEMGAEQKLDERIEELKYTSTLKLRLNLLNICNPLIRYASKYILQERSYQRVDSHYKSVRKNILKK